MLSIYEYTDLWNVLYEQNEFDSSVLPLTLAIPPPPSFLLISIGQNSGGSFFAGSCYFCVASIINQ